MKQRIGNYEIDLQNNSDHEGIKVLRTVHVDSSIFQLLSRRPKDHRTLWLVRGGPQRETAEDQANAGRGKKTFNRAEEPA